MENGVQKAMGIYRTYSIPGKAAALFPLVCGGRLSSAELQPRFPCLQWRTCPWAEHSDDDDDNDDIYVKRNVVFLVKIKISFLYLDWYLLKDSSSKNSPNENSFYLKFRKFNYTFMLSMKKPLPNFLVQFGKEPRTWIKNPFLLTPFGFLHFFSVFSIFWKKVIT